MAGWIFVRVADYRRWQLGIVRCAMIPRICASPLENNISTIIVDRTQHNPSIVMSFAVFGTKGWFPIQSDSDSAYENLQYEGTYPTATAVYHRCLLLVKNIYLTMSWQNIVFLQILHIAVHAQTTDFNAPTNDADANTKPSAFAHSVSHHQPQGPQVEYSQGACYLNYCFYSIC